MDVDDIKATQAMRELIRLDHRRMHLLSSLFSRYSMSGMDFRIMDIIYHYREEHPDTPGIYSSQIAQKCSVTRPAVSRQIQLLEKRGWVHRTVDPNSKRSAFVDLTNEGREVILRHYEVSKTFHDNVYYRMGEQKMEALLESMRQLTEAMEQEIERMKQQEAERGGNK